MRARAAISSLMILLVGIAAATVWQSYAYQEQKRAHIEEHVRHGRALLDAFESASYREFRGGRYDPEALHDALVSASESFDIRYFSIRSQSLGLLAEVGDRSAATEGAPYRYSKDFEPLRPRRAGRGPGWGRSRRVRDLPNAPLQLLLITDATRLEEALSQDLTRAITTTIALALVAVLVSLLFWIESRRGALRAELRASQEKLRNLEYLERLGAGLVHETKNPLGVVRGFAERLSRGQPTREELKDSVEAILDQTDRTVARLDEFLLLSRPARLRRERIELASLFEELARLLEPDLEAKQASLAIACGGASVEADVEQLRRLLMNLLINAVVAIGEGGKIELRCESDRIVVEDDGPGIPRELWDTIFEPYVTGREDGTGLGLSIAARIASDHGFRLWHEDRRPRGTRMVLRCGTLGARC